MAQALTSVTFVLHILAGAVSLMAGIIALCSSKGGRLHRAAGDVFVIAMVVMGLFAAVLGVIRPGQLINVFIAGFTLYLVITAWLTARRGDAVVGVPERVAMATSLALCVPFALLIFQVVTGVTIVNTAFTVQGPILIALCTFATVIALAAWGDLRLVRRGGIRGTPRIVRHIWRMCFGLALTFGSAFTNGFARLLPGPYHVPRVFFVPQLLMLGVLVYWVIRVRFPGWRKP
jgi:uncharacterized membrane protein